MARPCVSLQRLSRGALRNPCCWCLAFLIWVLATMRLFYNLQRLSDPSPPAVRSPDLLYLERKVRAWLQDTPKPQSLAPSAHAPPAANQTNLQGEKKGLLHEAKKPEKVEQDASSVLKDFGLYVRMNYGKRKQYNIMLIPSMRYFWFLPVNLTVVLDDTPQDRVFGRSIAAQFPYPKICYEKKIDSKYNHNNGKSFSELSNFYADNCFNKTFVGFVDTDTFFVTPVTPELLFNGTKPYVVGVYGNTNTDWKIGTKAALGKKEVFGCMSYFPVVVKVEHLIEMRQYMANLHNKTFLEVFQNFSVKENEYSQFSIICNYLWYFHRDEYQFHAQLHTQGAKWSETSLQPSMHYYNTSLTEHIKMPQPRSAVHYGHMGRSKKDLIRPGVCKSGGFILCPNVCDPKKEDPLHKDLFQFEAFHWTWDSRCLQTQEKHYNNTAENYAAMLKPFVLKGCEYLAGV